jgi:hypothetical protein
MGTIKIEVDDKICSMGEKGLTRDCYYLQSFFSGKCTKYDKKLKSNGKEYLRLPICKKESHDER